MVLQQQEASLNAAFSEAEVPNASNKCLTSSNKCIATSNKCIATRSKNAYSTVCNNLKTLWVWLIIELLAFARQRHLH